MRSDPSSIRNTHWLGAAAMAVPALVFGVIAVVLTIAALLDLLAHHPPPLVEVVIALGATSLASAMFALFAIDALRSAASLSRILARGIPMRAELVRIGRSAGRVNRRRTFRITLRLHPEGAPTREIVVTWILGAGRTRDHHERWVCALVDPERLDRAIVDWDGRGLDLARASCSAPRP
ncbi:hypothetical protein [Sandaracinus amylolyticus]|uniref:Uncharacterized protein n=1 Tax=Sandaracinus amylolyticus TaxID=927083 RepID=A0A0F6SF24_9BACT|nr:hypothetical protein [Sandaracinus amylolyticus]AKF06199.1 hypothetical protein DB32_003348 [Sandaracinus amylolyticus]AYM52199.1 hypothetical protein [Sandaracinus amylolyticus]